MSVLFSDIRDFAAIAEGNSPENNFKFINDDLLSDFFTNTNMERLKGHQTRFIAMLMCAPISFDTRALEYEHAHMPITRAHFQRVGLLLENALSEGGMERADIDTVMSRIASFEKVIVSKAES